ncbi:hypothetical protein ScPMuIL_005565 [Solemya velum]
MAEVSTFSQSRQSDIYFPTIPPKVNEAAVSYSQATLEAPYTALMGVIIDGRIPTRHPVTPRCRERSCVGLTNRWRLPESLGSDLLGSSQAIKAVSMPYNQSLINIITGESPRLCVNLDVSQPYIFRQAENRRSVTQLDFGRSESRLQRGLSTRSSTPQKKLTPPVAPIPKFIPKSARSATPRSIFLYHSKKSLSFNGPDVLLKCLGTDWELHRPFLQKSEVLSKLLGSAGDPKPSQYYCSPASQKLNNYIKQNNVYSSEYREITNRLSGLKDPDDGMVKKVDHPAHISELRVNSISIIKLDITDPFITKTAMAVALGNLYHDELDVNTEDVAGVLAAASVLGFKTLIDGCGDIMIKNISHRTVCKYYQASAKYQQDHVVIACERWLELNLIPQVGHTYRQPCTIALTFLDSSTSAYYYNKYFLFYLWTYLNCSISRSFCDMYSNFRPSFNGKYLPSDNNLNSLFYLQISFIGPLNSNMFELNKCSDFIFTIFFASSRWRRYVSHEEFLCHSNQTRLCVDDEPHYHSEIMSLHGFHFELKAVKSSDGSYTFYMQRLKPGDPMLSFRHCERHTFSMRPDRAVQYCISVQYFGNGDPHYYSTGVLTHHFGLGEKTSRSEVVQLMEVKKPVYVSFAVLFPAS